MEKKKSFVLIIFCFKLFSTFRHQLRYQIFLKTGPKFDRKVRQRVNKKQYRFSKLNKTSFQRKKFTLFTKPFIVSHILRHGLQTPGKDIAFTAKLKINSHSPIFRYDQSIFCLPHRPKFSDFVDLCRIFQSDQGCGGSRI